MTQKVPQTDRAYRKPQHPGKATRRTSAPRLERIAQAARSGLQRFKERYDSSKQQET